MSDLASQPRERVYLIDTASNPVPESGVGASVTPPQFILSPKCPGGEPCRGFAVTLFAPDSGGEVPIYAEPGAEGFTITFYRLNPSVGVWARCEPFVGAAYQDQLVCYDLGGGAALYAVIGNVVTPGRIHMLIAELP